MTPPRLPNPLWLPPFFGRVPPGVQRPHLRLLGVVALALLFEEYDIAMLNLALPQIAGELGMPLSELPAALAMIRAGALPAFFVIPLTDRIGRRPMFIAATALMGLFTFATAFAQTGTQFVVLQVLTRTCFNAGAAVAVVIVVEEFPGAHRGWGLGILSAIGATGHGLSAGIYAAVPHLPGGFRALYALGIVPVLLTPLFLARIPETRSFAQHRAASRTADTGGGLLAVLSPLATLMRQAPGRVLGVSVSGFACALGGLPSFQFASLYAQQRLSWTPAQVSLMVVAAGFIGILGNVVAGRAGDRFGRRRVGALLLSAFPLCSALYYNAGSPVLVALAFAGLVFSSMGGRVILRALSTELFPTGQRGAASGVYAVLEQGGALVGLVVVASQQVQRAQDLSWVVPAVASGLWLAALTVLAFPETRGRELGPDSVDASA